MPRQTFRFKDLMVQVGEAAANWCRYPSFYPTNCMVGLRTFTCFGPRSVPDTCFFNASTLPPTFTPVCNGFSDPTPWEQNAIDPETLTAFKGQLQEQLRGVEQMEQAMNAQMQVNSLEEAEQVRAKLNSALAELDARVAELKQKG